MSSIASGQVEQSCFYLEALVTSALKIGLNLSYGRHEVYQQMQAAWSQERKVKDLTELFQGESY